MAEARAHSFFDADAAARLMSRPLVSRIAMEGTMSGRHKSPHRGSSVEFAEYRNYAPGDDIRRLDWRVYAKTDRFYVKEFEAETNLRCYFLLDCSGSMGFAGKGRRKLDYARRIISTLAYLVVNQGDAVGLVCAQEKTSVDLPPKRNPAHLRLLFDQLEDVEAKGETGLVRTTHDLADRIRRRGLVVVLSDFFCDAEELVGAMQHLAFQKHDVAVFHLMDPEELDFRFDRPVRFEDMEGEDSVVAEPSLIRDDYLKYLHAHMDRVQRGCREIRADYRMLTTDQDIEKALADFLGERATRAAA